MKNEDLKELRNIVSSGVLYGLGRFLAWLIFGLLLGLLFLAVEVEASPLYARLVHARGPNALPQWQSRALFYRAIGEIKTETGIEIRLAKFQSIKNPFQRMHGSLMNAEPVLNAWLGWFSTRSSAPVKFAVVPPFRQDGKYWLLGYAVRCSHAGAYSTVEEKNSKGEYRVPQAYIALKHELMHELGAKHIDWCCNIMNADAMGCGGNATLPQSIQQIKSCAGRW